MLFVNDKGMIIAGTRIMKKESTREESRIFLFGLVSKINIIFIRGVFFKNKVLNIEIKIK